MKVWSKEDLNNFIENNVKKNKKNKVNVTLLFTELQKASQFFDTADRVSVGWHFIARVKERFGFDMTVNEWCSFWDTQKESMILCYDLMNEGTPTLGIKHTATDSFFPISKNVENESWSIRTAWSTTTSNTSHIWKAFIKPAKEVSVVETKIFSVKEGIEFFKKYPNFEGRKVKGSKKISLFYKGKELIKLFDLKDLHLIISHKMEKALFTYLRFLGDPENNTDPNLSVNIMRNLLPFIGDVRINLKSPENPNLFNVTQTLEYVTVNLYTNLSKRVILDNYHSGNLLTFIIKNMVNNSRYTYQASKR